MPKIAFPTKIDAETKAQLIKAAEIRGISTNALAEELLTEGAFRIIRKALQEKPITEETKAETNA